MLTPLKGVKKECKMLITKMVANYGLVESIKANM